MGWGTDDDSFGTDGICAGRTQRLTMFINVQPIEGPPRLVNINHIVAMTGDMLVLSTGATMRLSAESVLRVHGALPKLEG